MSRGTRLFGTDGVRGVAGEWPLDAPTIARIGAAIVRAHPLGRPTRLVIGRDTRESGEWIARELARGAAGEGAVLTSIGVAPTPAVAYLAGALDFDLGVVLSASHNPYADNGIKVFSGRGEKFGEDTERDVEAVIADASWNVSDRPAEPISNEALVDAYLEHVARLLPSPGGLAGARIAVDMANGATVTTARRVLERLGFHVVAMGDRPDGRNINLACGSTHPERLAALVVAEGCRLGLAFDGDGDRVILIDASGRIVDGDAMMLILALAEQRAGRLAGDTVVATVMSNIGLEIALRKHGIRLLRAPVGDKYVMDAMVQGGYVIGGEQSGHVILASHLPTGDGLATALAVLAVMADTGRELGDLARELVTYPQTLVNVRVRERTPVASVPAIQHVITGVESKLDGRGRVLIRYSGTEPLLRIMIEGEDQTAVQTWANEIADAAKKALGEAS
jgi:phosphoglucosamine mutase